MLNEVEKAINDMVTGIEKIENDTSNEIGKHYKTEMKIRLIEKTLYNIGCYDSRYKSFTLYKQGN